MNHYFTNVGPNLAEKLPRATKPFESFLKADLSPSESFQINPTNPGEVFKLINSFSSSNCVAPDQTCPKIYKLGAEAISIILPERINDCFSNGYFPSPLKEAKVIPIFKGDNPEEFGNWRPISITSSTSKLIEKIVKKTIT